MQFLIFEAAIIRAAARLFTAKARWQRETTQKPYVRASTRKTCQGFISNHIEPAIGNIMLVKLTTMDLQKLYKQFH